MKTIEIARIIEEHRDSLSSSEIAYIIKRRINDKWRNSRKDQGEDIID